MNAGLYLGATNIVIHLLSLRPNHLDLDMHNNGHGLYSQRKFGLRDVKVWMVLLSGAASIWCPSGE